MNKRRNFLILGASRGLGAAFAAGLPKKGDHVFGVSRTQLKGGPGYLHKRTWIEADLRKPSEAIRTIVRVIGTKRVDVLILNAGIWETVEFERTSTADIMDIVSVNLTSSLLLVRELANNLRAGHGNIIVIGSTCGLDNEGASNAGYVATKFAARGLVHSLRELFRSDFVRVTCISPGSIASEVSFEDGSDAALDKYRKMRIPVGDIVSLVRCILCLSVASCVKEVIVPATLDTDV
jgi:short-subunit dehydrogenase